MQKIENIVVDFSKETLDTDNEDNRDFIYSKIYNEVERKNNNRSSNIVELDVTFTDVVNTLEDFWALSTLVHRDLCAHKEYTDNTQVSLTYHGNSRSKPEKKLSNEEFYMVSRNTQYTRFNYMIEKSDPVCRLNMDYDEEAIDNQSYAYTTEEDELDQKNEDKKRELEDAADENYLQWQDYDFEIQEYLIDDKDTDEPYTLDQVKARMNAIYLLNNKQNNDWKEAKKSPIMSPIFKISCTDSDFLDFDACKAYLKQEFINAKGLIMEIDCVCIENNMFTFQTIYKAPVKKLEVSLHKKRKIEDNNSNNN
jgi:hypothetical protein